jgi:hypothetical protein
MNRNVPPKRKTHYFIDKNIFIFNIKHFKQFLKTQLRVSVGNKRPIVIESTRNTVRAPFFLSSEDRIFSCSFTFFANVATTLFTMALVHDFVVSSPNVTYTEDLITSDYTYSYTKVKQTPSGTVVIPIERNYKFQVKRKVPKLGYVF